jgi:hypothetical protein
MISLLELLAGMLFSGVFVIFLNIIKVVETNFQTVALFYLFLIFWIILGGKDD